MEYNKYSYISKFYINTFTNIHKAITKFEIFSILFLKLNCNRISFILKHVCLNVGIM